MATRIQLTPLETRILNLVFGSDQGYERVEEIHAAMGVDEHEFVDALQSLEGDGYVAVRNLGGAIVVGLDDPLLVFTRPGASASPTRQVGTC